jgi:hypothetical protein
VLGLVICALLVGGLTTFDSSLLALALPPLVYLAAAVVLRPTEFQLQVQRRVTQRLPILEKSLPSSCRPRIVMAASKNSRSKTGYLKGSSESRVPPA